MHFGNSAGNFGGTAVRRPVGHDSAAAMSKLVALLPNYMQIVQNWSEKGVLALRALYPPNPLIQNILEFLTSLNRAEKTVKFCWIPSHVGIAGN